MSLDSHYVLIMKTLLKINIKGSIWKWKCLFICQYELADDPGVFYLFGTYKP